VGKGDLGYGWIWFIIVLLILPMIADDPEVYMISGNMISGHRPYSLQGRAGYHVPALFGGPKVVETWHHSKHTHKYKT